MSEINNKKQKVYEEPGPKISIKRLMFTDKQEPLNQALVVFKSHMEFEDSNDFALAVMDILEGFESVFESDSVDLNYNLKENKNLHLLENIGNLFNVDK